MKPQQNCIIHEYGYTAVSTTDIFVHISPDFVELHSCKTRAELLKAVRPIIKCVYPQLTINFARGAGPQEGSETYGIPWRIKPSQIPF